MFSLSLISFGMVILPCTPTLTVYSAMHSITQRVYMVFFTQTGGLDILLSQGLRSRGGSPLIYEVCRNLFIEIM